MTEGQRVTCLEDSIDTHFGAGMNGTVKGFARLSAYHPREVLVDFGDWSAWFWERDVSPIEAAA